LFVLLFRAQLGIISAMRTHFQAGFLCKPTAVVMALFLSLTQTTVMADAAAEPTPAEVQAVKEYIRAGWPGTIRTTGQPEMPKEIALPKSFTVPTSDPIFRVFFYWDTYFTSIGLVHDGQTEVACNNTENMVYLIEKLGFVPNSNTTGRDNRSQPPVAALQVELCLPYQTSREWRERAYNALEQEYAFWMTFRAFPDGLNHYGGNATPNQLKSFAKGILPRLPAMPEEPVARGQFVNHAIAVAESGWDFTPRWDDRCPEFASVDLNSLLYVTERVAGDLAKELGNGQETKWRKRMNHRRETMYRLMWDKKRGIFQDYDEANRRKSSFVSAASFFPLFCGVADADEAKKSAKTLLAALETPYGLDTALAGPRDQTYQWDSPNLWPPLQWVAVKGLLASGQREAAVRLARKYVATVTRNFKTSHHLWEKYNARAGTIDVSDEYEMPVMMGWTAGVFLACCEVAGY